jgi:uncharacterized protein (DUF58 family)
MIVPSRRLIALAFLVAAPAAAVTSFGPGLALVGWLVLVAWAVVAAADVIFGLRRADSLRLGAASSLRLAKDVPAPLPVTVDNLSRNSISVRVAVLAPLGVSLSQPVREMLCPSGATVVDWECTGNERGDHSLGQLHTETQSPLRLWRIRSSFSSGCTLRVYPNLRDRATAAIFLRTAGAGVRLRRQLGKGKEFENLRHYMPGDNFEDIHWKATARRAFPMVKLYNVEHAQEVYAVIDCSRLSARDGALDHYVDAALHLALIANSQRDRFGLSAFSDSTSHFVRASSGLVHFRLCRESIYRLSPRRVSPDFRDVFTALDTKLRRRALLMFFTALDDALLAETFEHNVTLLARRHVVLVNVLAPSGGKPLFKSDPADIEELYGSLAVQISGNRMRRLQISLQNRGVRLSVVEANRLKSEVASQYLEVKGRQLL